jgi:CRISPR/Cas system-associated exonuclease Cas4 (RecB family)
MIDAATALTSEGFDEIQRETLTKQIAVWPARAWHPSSVGSPCDRQLVWNWTKADEKKPHDYVLQSIFNVGTRSQPFIYDAIERLGFDIIRESDRPRRWKMKSGVEISGRIDGKIIGFKGDRYSSPRVLELKTMADHQWDGLKTLDDVRNAEAHYVRGYFAQGQLYLLLEELSEGVFVFQNKTTGLLRLIPFEIDYAFAEALLTRLERLQPFVRENRDPDPIPFNWRICGGCGFRDLCYPAINYGEGASVIESQDLIELLERREKLHPAAKEFERVDKGIKEQLVHLGISHAVAGDFVVEGTQRKRKAYTVKETEYVQFSIERILKKPADG